MKNDLKRLLEITKSCRDDMHEPDEQGLIAHIVGNKLDNAFGDHISIEAVINGYQEFVIMLDHNEKIEKFNLATLIALARKAVL